MANYDDAFKQFTDTMNELGLHYHDEGYHAVMKHLGPSVHLADASLVACSDPKELELIKENFLVGKLGYAADDARLDQAIAEVCGALGESNRHKHRTTFYYLLVAVLGDDFSKLS